MLAFADLAEAVCHAWATPILSGATPDSQLSRGFPVHAQWHVNPVVEVSAVGVDNSWRISGGAHVYSATAIIVYDNSAAPADRRQPHHDQDRMRCQLVASVMVAAVAIRPFDAEGVGG